MMGERATAVGVHAGPVRSLALALSEVPFQERATLGISSLVEAQIGLLS
mgnify:CR=1 FL=1